MLHQLEGSQAIAQAVALSRPNVVCAYPITPQTHIVEGVGEFVRNGQLENCEFINVESEMAALSVSIGAEAAGVRSYTATSSQGLLYMIEAVYNASGLRLPIVMTLGNRAIGSPINIWNDQTDAMSVRDAGWIMLFAETNQEAADLHIQAFRIAETVRCPVMVCVDGFILTHAYERVDIPSQEEVDDFLPSYQPEFRLDTKDPESIGLMVAPEYFTEVRYLAHLQQKDALVTIKEISDIFSAKFKRNSGGLIREYRTEYAETLIITMGSVAGTIKDVVDELNANGGKFGVISIVSYRPFPIEAIRKATEKAKNIIVVEKDFAVGLGGILSREIAYTLSCNKKVTSVIAGLGGRAITKSMLSECFTTEHEEDTVFLGLKRDVVEREYARISK